MEIVTQWVMDNPEWIAIFTATLIAELFIGKTKKTCFHAEGKQYQD